MTNTTKTEPTTNPIDLLTADERAQVLAQLERARRESDVTPAEAIKYLYELAENTLAWRGRE